MDVAIAGAGFTGLATAHYVRQLCPDLRVAVFEAQQVGNGASGRTGGLVLEDTAVGPLPGVGNCIATLQELVHTQGIQCDLQRARLLGNRAAARAASVADTVDRSGHVTGGARDTRWCV